MALTWKLSEIRTKFRAATGLKTEEDITNDDADNLINDYYQNIFPLVAYVPELEDWFTQATEADDGGEYAIDAAYLRLMTPATTLDSDDVLSECKLYQDKDKFFSLYPEVKDPTTGHPASAFLWGGTLYLRPESDAVYTFRSACIKKPDVLEDGDSVPLNVRWGPCIGYGTAIEKLVEEGNMDRAAEIEPLYQHLLTLINRGKIMQKNTNQRAVPRF